MTKAEVEDIYRWRKTLVQNFDSIIKASKSSKKADLSSQGQLDLFSMGMEDVKTSPKLIEYDGFIDLMEFVNIETELIGLPISYNPLDELWIYEELYCSHRVTELLELTSNIKGVIILDRIIDIEHRTSKAWNKYAKIRLSNLPSEMYLYLMGDSYINNIVKCFVNECYLIQLSYRLATPEFSKDSMVITNIKNVRDVDIDSEYKRLIKQLWQ